MAIKISGSTIIDDSRNIVNAGVTTVGVLTGTDAKFSGTVEANEFLGTGTKLSGIVTSIVAGSNISVDQSTGQVTITGLANTANVISDTITTGTLNVTGVSTFGNSIDANGDLSISGLSTFSSNIDVNGLSSLADINVSGASTFTGSIDANGTADFDLLVEMDDVNVSSALTSKDIDVSSLLTATNINATGIVSSTDGRLIAGVGVQTSGGYIGTGVTTFDFRGNGLSTVTTPSSGFSTVFVDFNGQGALWQKDESNFTASEGRITFTKTYQPGYLDVYLNGVRLNNENYTATNGTSVGLTTATNAGDKVDIIAYNGNGAAELSVARTVGLVTATSGQTVFTVPSYDLGSNSLDVFLNGIKLEPTEFTETDGTTITLAVGAGAGDILEAYAYDTSGGNYWQLTGNTLHRSTYNNPVAIGTDIQNGDSYLTVGQPGAAGTSLFVYGGARITGILTVGEGSITIDGSTGRINVGSANNILFGTEAGLSLAADGVDNVFLGKYSGRSTTSGDDNVFLAKRAGCNNTTGSNNVFLGVSAGQGNVSGNNNIAMGVRAGYSIDAGSNNVFLGLYAGCSNTGSHNIAIGCAAGREVTTGLYNVLLGRRVGDAITTGCYNVAIGDDALTDVTDGVRNVAIGDQSGRTSTASCGVFIGYLAGSNNTTGQESINIGRNAGFNMQSGARNIFLGTSAGYSNNTGTGDDNIGMGLNVLYQLSSGYWNVGLGYCALNGMTTGICNIGIGPYAGRCTTTGSNNIMIGRSTGNGGLAGGNLTTESNRIILGTTSHTCAQIQIAWTVVSDVRDKKVLGTVPYGREFLRGIDPIKYQWLDERGSDALREGEKIHYGFSAQNILEQEHNVIPEENGVIISEDYPDKLQFTESHLIPVLVNAIKELDTENIEIKSKLESIEEQNQNLIDRLSALENKINNSA